MNTTENRTPTSTPPATEAWRWTVAARHAPLDAIDQRRRGHARAVLRTLADHAGRDGRCWPHVETIATETGWSERTVRRALADLDAAGIIDRYRRRRSDGRWSGWSYRLRIDPAPLAEPPDQQAAGPPDQQAGQELPQTSELPKPKTLAADAAQLQQQLADGMFLDSTSYLSPAARRIVRELHERAGPVAAEHLHTAITAGAGLRAEDANDEPAAVARYALACWKRERAKDQAAAAAGRRPA